MVEVGSGVRALASRGASSTPSGCLVETVCRFNTFCVTSRASEAERENSAGLPLVVLGAWPGANSIGRASRPCTSTFCPIPIPVPKRW